MHYLDFIGWFLFTFENHVRNELRRLEDFTGTLLRVFWRGKEKE